MQTSVWWIGIAAAAAAAALLPARYMTSMPGRSYRGPAPPVGDEARILRARLEAHVRALAGEIGERNVYLYEALQAAAEYIRRALTEYGYEVHEQIFAAGRWRVANLEAVLPGDRESAESVVIGAHYDTAVGSPGADDNASGVAALLELARSARMKPARRTRRFVAFVNEEPPFFMTGAMGSRVYALRARARKEPIAGMLSLEAIGYFSDAPGSQKYPFPVNLFYPKTGDFIGFVGNLSSRSLVRRVIGIFREHGRLPSEGIAAPAVIPGISWSDHRSFWKEGYPAVMVTDTALYRNPHYHRHSDVPESLDYERLARVVAGLDAVLDDLASVTGVATSKLASGRCQR